MLAITRENCSSQLYVSSAFGKVSQEEKNQNYCLTFWI